MVTDRLRDEMLKEATRPSAEQQSDYRPGIGRSVPWNVDAEVVRDVFYRLFCARAGVKPAETQAPSNDTGDKPNDPAA